MAFQRFKFLLLFLLIFSVNSFGQIGPGKYKDIEDLQKRKLIIEFIDENEFISSEQAEKLNKDLLDAVKLQWTTHKNFEIKSEKEAYKLYHEGNKNYAIIKYDIIKVDKVKVVNNIRTVIGSWHVGNIGLSFIESAYLTKPEYLFNLPIRGSVPSKIDLQVAIKFFQNFVDFRVAKKNLFTDGKRDVVQNAATFRTKTLLLDKNDIDPKLTSSEIKAVFPYNFKIVEQAEIEKAIIEKDPNFLFVHITPLNVNSPNQQVQQVYDSEKINMLGGSVKNFAIDIVDHGQTIKKGDLEEYQSFIPDKK